MCVCVSQFQFCSSTTSYIGSWSKGKIGIPLKTNFYISNTHHTGITSPPDLPTHVNRRIFAFPNFHRVIRFSSLFHFSPYQRLNHTYLRFSIMLSTSITPVQKSNTTYTFTTMDIAQPSHETNDSRFSI